MRFSGRVLLASAMVVSACGGGDKKATADTAAAAATPAAEQARLQRLRLAVRHPRRRLPPPARQSKCR